MKKHEIQEITDNILAGIENKYEIGMLFIRLRPHVAKNPILLDISNFVAHYDGRDKGVSYNCVKKFVLAFLSASEKGGFIPANGPVFSSTDVMNNLISTLTKIGINFDTQDLLNKSDFLVEAIKSLITDTEFRFSDPRVYKCYVGRFNNSLRFCMRFNLKGPEIQSSPDAVISIDLFD